MDEGWLRAFTCLVSDFTTASPSSTSPGSFNGTTQHLGKPTAQNPPNEVLNILRIVLPIVAGVVVISLMTIIGIVCCKRNQKKNKRINSQQSATGIGCHLVRNQYQMDKLQNIWEKAVYEKVFTVNCLKFNNLESEV